MKYMYRVAGDGYVELKKRRLTKKIIAIFKYLKSLGIDMRYR